MENRQTKFSIAQLFQSSAIRRGPNEPDNVGLISLTWVFCRNFVKIHLVVIEILSFSCSVLLLVKADGDHLAVSNGKKIIKP